VLQNSETERDQGIVCTQASPVRQAHPHPIIRVPYGLNSGIRQDLLLGEKFSGLGPNDARESALISRQEVLSRKATLVAIKGEVIRLEYTRDKQQGCGQTKTIWLRVRDFLSSPLRNSKRDWLGLWRGDTLPKKTQAKNFALVSGRIPSRIDSIQKLTREAF
jgi:hypothetical protein